MEFGGRLSLVDGVRSLDGRLSLVDGVRPLDGRLSLVSPIDNWLSSVDLSYETLENL